MAKFKKGQVVKLVSVVPQGPVQGIRMDDEGDVQYLIEWKDADEVIQQRWFEEGELATVI